MLGHLRYKDQLVLLTNRCIAIHSKLSKKSLFAGPGFPDISCVVHISGNFLYNYISCLLEVLNRNRKAISLLCCGSILFGCAGEGFVHAGILLRLTGIVVSPIFGLEPFSHKLHYTLPKYPSLKLQFHNGLAQLGIKMVQI